jgi:hypothetical protein
MAHVLTRRVHRGPWEFERGPLQRRPGGHEPDFSLSVLRTRRAPAGCSQGSAAALRSNKQIILDTLFIVEILGTSQFDRITEIDGSSRHLNAIDLSSIRKLSSVKKADFSDNRLPLEPFAVMPVLEDLDLSCNSLKEFDYKSSEAMTSDNRAWNSLTTLNLAYNSCSRSVTDLQIIPRLSKLNLSFNSLSYLPSNLMHFTCLTYIDLTGNNLNSDPAFFSLATIPALQTLILNENNITRVPKLRFGFEALRIIALNGNKIEEADDIVSLTGVEQLQEVSILGNPILLRVRRISTARQAFAAANIELKCCELPQPIRHSIVGPLKTVRFDPLTLPSFTDAHLRALNRKPRGRATSPVVITEAQPSLKRPPKDDVFMTSFASKTGEDEERRIEIEPTPLPEPDEPVITSVWSEVPVVQFERRVQLTPALRSDFVTAFRKLEFLVAHPEIRLRPRESTCLEPDEGVSVPIEQVPNLIAGKEPPEPPKKSVVASQLAARTEYTKKEIEGMLQSMEERLAVVERDLMVADESGQSAVDMALDQKNFSMLHKQYETIRAELINTLNS